MSDTCVPSVIVIDTAINQLETKVSFVAWQIFQVWWCYGFGSTALQQD